MCAATGPATLAGTPVSGGSPAVSDLIVIGHPDEHRAHGIWAELVKLQHDDLVDLEDAAIIWRDENGELHVTMRAPRGGQGYGQRPVLGTLSLADRTAGVPVDQQQRAAEPPSMLSTAGRTEVLM